MQEGILPCCIHTYKCIINQCAVNTRWITNYNNNFNYLHFSAVEYKLHSDTECQNKYFTNSVLFNS